MIIGTGEPAPSHLPLAIPPAAMPDQTVPDGLRFAEVLAQRIAARAPDPLSDKAMPEAFEIPDDLPEPRPVPQCVSADMIPPAATAARVTPPAPIAIDPDPVTLVQAPPRIEKAIATVAPASPESAPSPSMRAPLIERPAPTPKFVSEKFVSERPSARATALRFNEDGFFARTVFQDPPRAEAPPESPVASVVQLPLARQDAPEGPSLSNRPIQSPLRPFSAAAAPVQSTRASPTSPTSEHGRSKPSVIARPALVAEPAGTAPKVDTPETIAPLPQTRRRAPSPATTAAFSPIAIAVQDVAGGLGVVARIGGLSEAERLRLSDDIARLLARHGFVAADINIAAPIAAARQRKGFA
ncbi:hypothetical protein [uncultured Sphingomonas sp.]|uniref:hypothetical protein n=1 Tax=uncultured Sphingomonas sp. TaxID=158754 RepID=UPI0025FBEC46|nr:hypothetical protein [uncultured Sphingomonas sp.]